MRKKSKRKDRKKEIEEYIRKSLIIEVVDDPMMDHIVYYGRMKFPFEVLDIEYSKGFPEWMKESESSGFIKKFTVASALRLSRELMLERKEIKKEIMKELIRVCMEEVLQVIKRGKIEVRFTKDVDGFDGKMIYKVKFPKYNINNFRGVRATIIKIQECAGD